jgi:hypothetical protein
VTVARSLLLFALAALAEIGGAWLVWRGVREHRGWIWIPGSAVGRSTRAPNSGVELRRWASAGVRGV